MYFDHEDIPPASINDLILFKELPEETQRLAERVIKNPTAHYIPAYSNDDYDSDEC